MKYENIEVIGGAGTKQRTYEGKKATMLFPAELIRCGKWGYDRKNFEPQSCLNINVDSDLETRYGVCESVEVTVNYFDAGDGSFTLLYDGEDSEEALTEIVDLHNSMKWRNYTFYIKNPHFKKRCGGYDIRVSVFSRVMGNSFEPVAIGDVLVKKTGRVSPVLIHPATSENPGNIFFNGDKMSFTSKLSNRTGEKLSLKAKYSLVDRDTFNTEWEAEDEVGLEPNGETTITVEPKTNRYGVYLFKIELFDGDGVYSGKNTKAAYVNSSLDVAANMTLGFSDHFAQGFKGKPDIPVMLMRKGGFGINRDEILWKDYELRDGEYKVPDFEEDYLEVAARYGIEPIFTLGKNNVNIGVKNCPARTAEEQERFRLYVRNVVSDLKGRVKYYSIYNEPNLAFKKVENVHWYVEDLKIAYEEIKSVDPDALVIGFTVANIPYYWFEEAFKQGALNYCDVVDIHPYCWNTSPEEFDFVERVKRVYALIKKYGGSQPVWNTEFGYPVMPKGCGILSENLQGEYIMHTYMYSRMNNILDKFYIYQFVDSNNLNRGNCEANFGVLYSRGPGNHETPYAAKPAYLMLANMNNLIQNAKCLGEFFCHDRMTMARFERPDGMGVFAYWAYWNTAMNYLTMDLGTDTIKMYDKYGNAEILKSENGIYEIPVKKETIFIEGRFTRFEDLSEYPA